MKAILKRMLIIVLTFALIGESLNFGTITVEAADRGVSFDFNWGYGQQYTTAAPENFGARTVFHRWYNQYTYNSTQLKMENQYDEYIFDLGKEFWGYQVDSVVINVGYQDKAVGIRLHSASSLGDKNDSDKLYVGGQWNSNGQIVVKSDFTGKFRYVGFLAESANTKFYVNSVTVIPRAKL